MIKALIGQERVASLALLGAGLKEVKEWQLFINHLGEKAIHEFREHKGKPLEALKDIATDLAAGQLKVELLEAIKDSANIPAEFKNATAADYIDLALVELFEIPAIVEAFKV